MSEARAWQVMDKAFAAVSAEQAIAGYLAVPGLEATDPAQVDATPLEGIAYGGISGITWSDVVHNVADLGISLPILIGSAA